MTHLFAVSCVLLLWVSGAAAQTAAPAPRPTSANQSTAPHVHLLATGGTAKAVVDLVEGLGGEVAGLLFVVELDFLNGRSKFDGHRVESLIRYDS